MEHTKAFRTAPCSSLWIALCITLFALDSSSEITGRVVTAEGTPIVGATVRVQLTDIESLTDESGHFILPTTVQIKTTIITAWKSGFYILSVKADQQSQPIMFKLTPIPASDHPDYTWQGIHTDTGCADCHGTTIVPQWEANAHSRSISSALVQAVYQGTTVAGQPEPSYAYLEDYPGIPGDCASCHAPGAAVDEPFRTFLHSINLQDRPRLGVSCDICHKIIDTKVPKQNMPGVLSIEFRRPEPGGRELLFGPFDDVQRGNDSYLPLIKESRFCAPCHSHTSRGTPIYSSYPEWLASDYPRQDIQCQDCHYAPDGRLSNVAPDDPEGRGVFRDPSTVPSHNLMGEDRTRFIASAVELEVEAAREGNHIIVRATLTNSGAGHHFPTGQPMRNVVLLVEAKDPHGRELELVKGELLPALSGAFKGRPGRFYAKILEERSTSYPDRPLARPRVPARQWVATNIRSDTRIPANSTASSEFVFLDKEVAEVVIEARLLYFRTFDAISVAKKFNQPGILLHTTQITVIP